MVACHSIWKKKRILIKTQEATLIWLKIYICLHFQFGALKGWDGIGIPIFFFLGCVNGMVVLLFNIYAWLLSLEGYWWYSNNYFLICLFLENILK
jgi:hypothetical protein